MRVCDVMSAPAVTVRRDAPLSEAVRVLMRTRRAFAPVVDDDGRVSGVLSATDLGARPRTAAAALVGLRAVWGRGAGRLRAAEVMSQPAVTAAVEDDAAATARRMIDASIRRMPVLADGVVVGVVSCSDLLRALQGHEQATLPTLRTA